MLPLLLLTPLLAQEPVPPPPDPARERWNALQKAYTDAPALRLRAVVTIADPEADETEARTLRLAIEADLMRPGAGRILLDGAETGPGDESEPFRILYLGDGESIYQVDETEQLAVREGGAWNECSAMFFLSFLGKSWSGEQVGAERVAFLPAREDQPSWIGIGLTGPDLYGDESTASAWFDDQGALRSFRLPIGGSAALVMEISALETIAEPDPKAFVHAVPEGYEITEPEEPDFGDLEAGLLAVGADAPKADFIGMDDAGFDLASLRGKTVLLNFWFYH